MIITYEEILHDKTWLNREILQSLTQEVIDKAKEQNQYDIKLLVNGIELEPMFLTGLINNIEKYVDRQAEDIVEERLSAALNKAKDLTELIDVFSDKIRELYFNELKTI